MIDMHSHFFPPITRDEAHAFEPARAPWLAVERGASQGQIMLADKPFRPVYQALWDPDYRVQELDAQGIDVQVVCATPVMHPWDMMGGGNRMKKWMLPWLVTMAAETQLGMLSLILSGALERIPESLRICFAHGGGSFAFLLGRADNAWRHRDIETRDVFQAAHRNRQVHFQTMGATSTDHGHPAAQTSDLSEGEAQRLLDGALVGTITAAEAEAFRARAARRPLSRPEAATRVVVPRQPL